MLYILYSKSQQSLPSVKAKAKVRLYDWETGRLYLQKAKEYVSATVRILEIRTRIKEHKFAFKCKNRNSKFGSRAIQTYQPPDFTKTTIIERNCYVRSRIFIIFWHMNSAVNPVNETGYIPSEYSILLWKKKIYISRIINCNACFGVSFEWVSWFPSFLIIFSTE